VKVTVKLGRRPADGSSRVAQSTSGAVGSSVSTIRHPKFGAASIQACTSFFTSVLTHPADEGTAIVASAETARLGWLFQVRPVSVQAEVTERSSCVRALPELLVRQRVREAAVIVAVEGMLDMSNFTYERSCDPTDIVTSVP